VKTVLILVLCPEDNFTQEPEGVDIPPVDSAILHCSHHRSGSEILKV